jgi:hypothetical protein
LSISTDMSMVAPGSNAIGGNAFFGDAVPITATLSIAGHSFTDFNGASAYTTPDSFGGASFSYDIYKYTGV